MPGPVRPSFSQLAGGALAAMVDAFDWGGTSLGPIAGWPQSLRTVVRTVLASPVPIVMVWGSDARLIYNDAYAVFAGGRHPQLLGMNVEEGWPEVADFNREILRVTGTGQAISFRDHSLVLHRRGEPEVVWMDLDYSPLYDDDDRYAGFFAVVVETTEHIQARRERHDAETAYHRASEQIDLALEAGAVLGTWGLNLANNMVTGDARFANFFSMPPEAAEAGLPLAAYVATIHPDDLPQVTASINEAIAGCTPFRSQYRVRQADGHYAWVEASGRCIIDEHGKPQRLPGVLIDIAPLKAAEQQLRVMINELNHRVKNTMAIVQAIATQSFRGSDNATGVEDFNARIVALAKAHDILTRQGWESAEVSEVVKQVLWPVELADGHRLLASGPNVRLSPQQAVALAMALHELSTNAIKYGALGAHGGLVRIEWTLLDTPERTFRLAWSEQGGPPVTPPTRQGFGTRLIERAMGAQLGGSVALHYHPTGVICEMQAPIL